MTCLLPEDGRERLEALIPSIARLPVYMALLTHDPTASDVARIACQTVLMRGLALPAPSSTRVPWTLRVHARLASAVLTHGRAQTKEKLSRRECLSRVIEAGLLHLEETQDRAWLHGEAVRIAEEVPPGSALALLGTDPEGDNVLISTAAGADVVSPYHLHVDMEDWYGIPRANHKLIAEAKD